MSYGKYFIRFLRIFVRTKSDHTKMFYFLRQFENYYNVKKKKKKRGSAGKSEWGNQKQKQKRKKRENGWKGRESGKKRNGEEKEKRDSGKKRNGGEKKGGDREEDGDVDDGATDTNYPLENQNQKQKIAERMLRKLVSTSR